MHLTEAEALLQLSNQESDEGIVSDQSSSADPEDASKRVKVRYKIWNMLHAYKSFKHTMNKKFIRISIRLITSNK